MNVEICKHLVEIRNSKHVLKFHFLLNIRVMRAESQRENDVSC